MGKGEAAAKARRRAAVLALENPGITLEAQPEPAPEPIPEVEKQLEGYTHFDHEQGAGYSESPQGVGGETAFAKEVGIRYTGKVLSGPGAPELTAYLGSEYGEINRLLRTGLPYPETINPYGSSGTTQDVRAMSQLAGSRTTNRAITVFRGLGTSGTAAIPRGIGDIFEDQGVVSTSLRRAMADGWKTGAVAVIRVPKGARMLYTGKAAGTPGENEATIPPGSRYRVIRWYADGAGRPRVELELIGQKEW